MAARKGNKDRERIASEVGASLAELQDSGADYGLSSAFSEPERRRLLGPWEVLDHSVGGKPYVEDFARRFLPGGTLRDPSYECAYDFCGGICVKRLRVSGVAELPDGPAEYLCATGLALSWELGRGCILARAELGYRSVYLDGAPASVQELSLPGSVCRISYRLEGGLLVLEEGDDAKRLGRPSGAEGPGGAG